MRKMSKAQIARTLVFDAVADGVLVRPQTCSRCLAPTPHIVAHHENYDRPFQVIWLCHACHYRIHNTPEKEQAKLRKRKETMAMNAARKLASN
jgi:hypothetical protein